MADPDDDDHDAFVVNLIDDSVVSDTKTVHLASLEFLRSRRPRGTGERAQTGRDSFLDRSRQSVKIPSGPRRELDDVCQL